MPKVKYYFNTHSLKYEKVVVSLKKRLLSALIFVATASVFATVIILFAYRFFDSPKEKKLLREINQYQLQVELLSKRSDQTEAVLRNLENKDDNIYRVIMEAEPIPGEVRNGGFGGVNKYKELEGFDNSKLIVETTKKLDKISKELYIQSKSFDELFKLAKNKTDLLASIPAIQPLGSKYYASIGSGFGWRMDPYLKTGWMHTGIDFVAQMGTPIYATGNGTVISAEFGGDGYGNCVKIDHGYGYVTLYGHMSRIIAVRGQKVKRGELIGLVGSTGMSVGPHCHYEVIKNGVKINPINFFSNDLTPAEYQKVRELSAQQNQSFDSK
jgi:murein DD-endopeptidase MepM/ murein hydrolase activator NlpD